MKNKELLLTLWNRCSNRCVFCYNRGYYHFPLDIKTHLMSCIDILTSDKISEYSCIRLVGGEIFDGSINLLDVRQEFDEIIKILSQNNIKSVNVITNLLYHDLGDLYSVLTRLDNKITISTSYDLYGRFATLDDEKLWWTNLNQVKKDFGNLCVDVGINITQPMIEQTTKQWLDDFQDKIGNCNINFNQLFTGIGGKNKTDCDFSDLFPDRKSFLKFINNLSDWGYIKCLSESKNTRLIHYVFDQSGKANLSETDSTLYGCNIIDGYIDSDKSMQSDIKRVMDAVENK